MLKQQVRGRGRPGSLQKSLLKFLLPEVTPPGNEKRIVREGQFARIPCTANLRLYSHWLTKKLEVTYQIVKEQASYSNLSAGAGKARKRKTQPKSFGPKTEDCG
ncbi:MAG: hypothetical protein AB7G28_17980 [Pirellulales bacterium]